MKATVAIALAAGLPAALASAILKPRIIGPDEPTDGYKFVVSIQDSEKVHTCGGMLLDSTTVLTASHCFTNTTDAGFVVAGKTDLEGTGGVTVKISTLQRPFHKPHNLQSASAKDRMSDIGIIKLATPIEKSDDIEYAPLPTSDAVPDRSSELVALGWGRNIWTKGQADFSVPKRAEALLEQQPCTLPWHAGDASTLICAGKPGKTVCLGDSGGPLIDSKTGALVGLTSISILVNGSFCADAGVFTRVGSYLDFINENLGQRGFADGDNQRVKDEAKMAVLRPALEESCAKQYSGKYNVCIRDATAAFVSGERYPTLETLKAKYQEVDKCQAILDMESACYVCVEEADVDSTAETVIQCSEKGIEATR